jgi:outer membrane protein assembly factor BamB
MHLAASARRAASVMVAAAILFSSGCAWFGGGDKKPTVLPELKSNDLSLAWSASVGKSASMKIVSSPLSWFSGSNRNANPMFVPAFMDRAVYAASADGSIYALSEEAGRVINQLDAKARLTAGVSASDNMVVVGTDKGDVIAMDAGGRQLWKTPIAGELLAPPTLVQTNVIVRTSDGRLIALNRIDGKRKWFFQRTPPPLTVRSNASVLSSRGVIYVGYPGGKLVALEADTGKAVWESTLSLPRGSTELERVADVSGLPVLDDTRICAAVYQGRLGCVETLNGNTLWSRDISSANGVAVDGKFLYVSDTDGNVIALDKNGGATAWKLEKLKHREPGAPLVMKGKILVGDKDGLIHALEPEKGDLTGRLATDGSRVISLTMNGERAIAQTEKGGVFAITVR